MKWMAITLIALGSVSAQALEFNCDNIESIYQDKSVIDYTQTSVEKLKADQILPTKILISKNRKHLFLLRDQALLRIYAVAFGRNPQGPKIMEGDFKTPEGRYSVDFKKANSEYYKALHVSYPNKEDLERTQQMSSQLGKKLNPGGSIMIHGLPNDIAKKSLVEPLHPMLNWTQGCVAVTNAEIDEIYALVPVNTEIEICARTKDKEPSKNLLQKWGWAR